MNFLLERVCGFVRSKGTKMSDFYEYNLSKFEFVESSTARKVEEKDVIVTVYANLSNKKRDGEIIIYGFDIFKGQVSEPAIGNALVATSISKELFAADDELEEYIEDQLKVFLHEQYGNPKSREQLWEEHQEMLGDMEREKTA